MEVVRNGGCKEEWIQRQKRVRMEGCKKKGCKKGIMQRRKDVRMQGRKDARKNPEPGNEKVRVIGRSRCNEQRTKGRNYARKK